jgi:NAD(P)-dependent dehydrogenase (short-subunit alcohol dehydrogenase family)
MKALEGKVAVITGGSSGIGLATAKLFRDEGAKVSISGRNQKSLDDAIKELGPGVVAVRSDVSKLSDLDTLFNVVAKKLGRIDVLFTNAGITRFAPVSEVSEDAFEETFDINVKLRQLLDCYWIVPSHDPNCNDSISRIRSRHASRITGVSRARILDTFASNWASSSGANPALMLPMGQS